MLSPGTCWLDISKLWDSETCPLAQVDAASPHALCPSREGSPTPASTNGHCLSSLEAGKLSAETYPMIEPGTASPAQETVMSQGHREGGEPTHLIASNNTNKSPLMQRVLGQGLGLPETSHFTVQRPDFPFKSPSQKVRLLLNPKGKADISSLPCSCTKAAMQKWSSHADVLHCMPVPPRTSSPDFSWICALCARPTSLEQSPSLADQTSDPRVTPELSQCPQEGCSIGARVASKGQQVGEGPQVNLLMQQRRAEGRLIFIS